MSAVSDLSSTHGLMKEWRRRFHANPELSFEEHATAEFVAQRLEEFGYEVHRGIGRTGVVGRLKVGTSQRSVGLRADMDALPIQEDNAFEHSSKVAGKMHACGHDGHAASLLGAAEYLAKTRKFDGVLNLIFQPAEEVLGGAKAMIEDGLFERFPCDSVFGYHNFPLLPVGQYGVKAGAFMAGGAFFDIKIRGKGAHAAHPEAGVDPVLVACHVTTALQSIVSRNLRATESAVVSVTRITAGDAYNVVPAEAVMGGTVRAFSSAHFDMIEHNMRRIVEQTALAFGAEGELDFRREAAPLINDPEETRFVESVLEELAAPADIIQVPHPVMGSEDFAFMLEKAPGVYVFLGNAGADHAVSVHNPAYDFNDDLLPYAAAYYARIVERKLAPVAA